MEVDVVAIKAAFGDVDDEVASQCVELCKIFNMDAHSLFFAWEAMIFGPQQRVAELNKTTVVSFRDHLQRKVAETARLKKLEASRKTGMSLLRNGIMKSGGGSSSYLGAARVKVEPTSDILGGDKGRSRGTRASQHNVAFELEELQSNNRGYRYMYEKVTDRSEVLDDRVEEFAQLVREHYGISELGDPSATTEQDVVVVGRITLDEHSSSSGPVKLNEASLALETSRAMGSGIRVPFRFEAAAKVREARAGAGGVGMFPGAIVALRGKNGGGGWFMVSEMLSLPIPKLRTKQVDDAAFTACIACGPFTAESDLTFKPWQALLARLKKEMPDVVILVGPFLDVTHSLIKQGDVDTLPDKMFRDLIISSLQEFLDSKEGSLAVIIPSVKDILSDHAVFPQAKLQEVVTHDPRIKWVNNPCRFKLNNVSFAVSSVDVLFHLRKEEFFKRAAPVDSEHVVNELPPTIDPMANICRSLLEQRSYYPIFPVPQELSHEVNLDVTHAEHLNLCGENVTHAPEVFITPSRLKQFSRNIDGTTFVNPSFLTKGTYALLRFEGGTAAVQAEISKLA